MAAFYDRFPAFFWIAGGLLAIALYTATRYHLSGWPRLAQRFRTEQPQPVYAAYTWITFGYLVHYKESVTSAADLTGIYLAFLNKLGRPSLLIPWNEIEFLPRRNWMFVRYQPLRLGSQERVRCVLLARHADMLLRDANRQPIEPIVDRGLSLLPGHPTYTTPATPPPTITGS